MLSIVLLLRPYTLLVLLPAVEALPTTHPLPPTPICLAMFGGNKPIDSIAVPKKVTASLFSAITDSYTVFGLTVIQRCDL